MFIGHSFCYFVILSFSLWFIKKWKSFTHFEQVIIHKTCSKDNSLSFFSACIEDFLFLRGKETMEVVFLVESNDLWFIDSINDDEATACFVTAGEEPSLDELQGFTAYALTGKIAAYAKTANQHTRIAT